MTTTPTTCECAARRLPPLPLPLRLRSPLFHFVCLSACVQLLAEHLSARLSAGTCQVVARRGPGPLARAARDRGARRAAALRGGECCLLLLLLLLLLLAAAAACCCLLLLLAAACCCCGPSLIPLAIEITIGCSLTAAIDRTRVRVQHPEKLDDAASKVIDTIARRFPKLDIPIHSRYR
eukprot:SAG22_NODE_1705_length_3771_cov_1.831699_7_plen_179_part_00